MSRRYAEVLSAKRPGGRVQVRGSRYQATYQFRVVKHGLVPIRLFSHPTMADQTCGVVEIASPSHGQAIIGTPSSSAKVKKCRLTLPLRAGRGKQAKPT